jgi:hypothetical protein
VFVCVCVCVCMCLCVLFVMCVCWRCVCAVLECALCVCGGCADCVCVLRAVPNVIRACSRFSQRTTLQRQHQQQQQHSAAVAAAEAAAEAAKAAKAAAKAAKASAEAAREGMSSEEVTGCGGQRPVPDVRPTQTHTTHTHTHTHTGHARIHTDTRGSATHRTGPSVEVQGAARCKPEVVETASSKWVFLCECVCPRGPSEEWLSVSCEWISVSLQIMNARGCANSTPQKHLTLP